MIGRVTPAMFSLHATQNARRHSHQLSILQQQASTGLRLLKPSDDPAAMRSVLVQKIEDNRIETQLANIQDARTKLNVSVSNLSEINKIFVRAQDIALEGNQSDQPEVLAQEVDGLIDRLLTIANTQHDGQYIFSGTAVKTQPFVADDSGVRYAGASDRMQVSLDRSVWFDTFYSGAEIFQSRSRQQTVFLGGTGAAAGTGTDNGIGQGALLVQHTSTTYAGASGVQAGTGSAANDTIIGPAGAHTLTLNDTSGTGAGGTVSLNGGEAVAFTSADTNLKVTGPLGEVVYIDTTGITAGFNGTVDITANGTLSLDGGTTQTAIDFSANQVVTDSATGSIVNVDSTGIRQAGTSHLEFTGTSDAFQALNELRDELRNARGLSSSEFHQAMSRRITDLNRVRNSISDVVGQQSVELESLDALESRAQDLQLDVRKLISDLESADISETVINLQTEQNLLQFTYSSSVRLIDMSLLDFLR